MRFYEYGDPALSAVLLIHGMLTPYTIFEEHIAYFTREHFVIAVALDGHDGDAQSAFISAEQQAADIAAYLQANERTHLTCVCGISLGGVIAFELLKTAAVTIDHLVLDGAPLGGFGVLLTRGMTANYLRIVQKSRERDAKTLENFSIHFLPARFLKAYLRIADTISDASVKNAVAAASRDRLADGLPQTDTLIHYLHGTKINERASQKTAARLQALSPAVTVTCFSGDAHCERVINRPQAWLETVEKLICRC